MGTVVTGCMFAGLVVAAPAPFINKTPRWFRELIGYIVMAAGLWNVLWYGVQHLTEFWGWAALVSGALMIITALTIIGRNRVPKSIHRLKPIVLFLLFACALLYAITIARL
jgi:uncharacterized membrane protein HdeD (DUF308 family)